jgi:hypothetical protein
MSGSNGHDAAVAAAIGGESARQEKRFAELLRAIALAHDPQSLRDNARLLDVVRRLPRGDS